MYSLPYHNTLDTISFKKMLDQKNIHNSYKIFWLKSIVSHIERGYQEISFSSVVYEMFKESYDFIVLYHLRFGGTDIIPGLISGYNAISKNAFLHILKYEEIDRITKRITEFVPYRLLSSFFEDELKGVQDTLRNDRISKLSNNNPLTFYSIDRMSKKVRINDPWMIYVKDNIGIIKSWIDYELVHFLQRRNPSIPNIPFKVNPQKNRNLTRAKRLWNEAIQINPALNIDLFINSNFSENSKEEFGSFSIDHFLPWSFVSHDQLWNLIPVHKNINSAKSNSLPNESYIHPYIEMQYNFLSTIRTFAKKEEIEEYRALTSNTNFDIDNLCFDYFYNVLNDNTSSLYRIARNNGYSIWTGPGSPL